jgi:hypothetical protein
MVRDEDFLLVGLMVCVDDRGLLHRLEVDRESELLSWISKGTGQNYIGDPSAAC